MDFNEPAAFRRSSNKPQSTSRVCPRFISRTSVTVNTGNSIQQLDSEDRVLYCGAQHAWSPKLFFFETE